MSDLDWRAKVCVIPLDRRRAATQGDGELSGTAMAIGAHVAVRIDHASGLNIDAPWIETDDRLMSTSASLDFATARRDAIERMMRALESSSLASNRRKRWHSFRPWRTCASGRHSEEWN